MTLIYLWDNQNIQKKKKKCCLEVPFEVKLCRGITKLLLIRGGKMEGVRGTMRYICMEENYGFCYYLTYITQWCSYV